MLKNWKDTRIFFFELSICPETSQIMLVQIEKTAAARPLAFYARIEQIEAGFLLIGEFCTGTCNEMMFSILIFYKSNQAEY